MNLVTNLKQADTRIITMATRIRFLTDSNQS